jgi:hypothetical protein
VLPVDILGAHLAALILAWSCAWATGLPLAWLLGLRIGFGGGALLGVAYWAAALYCLPFASGLVAAGVIAALLGVVTLWQRAGRQALRRSLSCLSRAELILGIGCAAYLTMLATQYVPPGMDAAMHTIAARQIAQQNGLPTSYAPFAPELPFPAVNLGLPAFAAVVIRLGAEPVSAMLACEHVTFSGLLLATYLVLRIWVGRCGAAVPAVAAAWSARGAQETIGWGGFPTIMSLALGLLATRLLFDLARRPRTGTAIALGLTVGAMPLVHGAGAASWVYCVAPVAGIAALVQAPRCSAAMRQLVVASTFCSMILAACVLVGKPAPSDAQREHIRAWHRSFAPPGEGLQLAWTAPNYVKSSAGSLSLYGGALAALVLLVRRRGAAVAAAGAVIALISIVAANARYDVLPGSFLLFPERVVYWAPPLAALLMALGWQALPAIVRRAPVCWGVALALLAFTVPRQYNHFQRIAFVPAISPDAWNTLCWARDHLEPGATFVAAPYNSIGSYLPAVAGIATDGAPLHYLCYRPELEAYARREPTHRLIELGAGGQVPAEGVVVYQRGSILLCATRHAVSANSP